MGRSLEEIVAEISDDLKDYEKQLRDLQEAYGEAMLELRAQKAPSLSGCGGREMIRSAQQSLLQDGIVVPVTKLCAWFGVPRRSVCYKSVKSPPKADSQFAEPIKSLIEEEPSFGNRTVAWLMEFNKNTVPRIFQIQGWQVRKRPIRTRPRIEALPSVAQAPN